MLINFKTNKDSRGPLTVLEKEIPFKTKRIFYIFRVDESKREFHKDVKTKQVADCINGSCNIISSKNNVNSNFTFNNTGVILLIEPKDFNWMENFSVDAILLANEYY